ncbi:hypothetical protein SAMN05443633_11343 [Chryseobacterium arachidis]|uniref:Outer membrane receptor proteins, mostly Fe transport n=1 Tax=Chryseobacterium arachidis TaxID=1416778 RepID=A0A1M5ISR8_9FLAO|nr:DUF3659 domain-containing protein [Chryseobacterium arachidis]SHG30793.1 hypothetical protein SAMN05443633_11343 [Chryseobacterium arachidis]
MKNIISLLLFFSFEIFFSQNIKIKVADSFGKQLSNVNVQLQENGKTLQFKKTDQNGSCDFNIPTKGIYTLKFTSILYKAKLVEINTNDRSDFEVVLENQITEIKEVEIKSRPKIATAKGDTISYNIKAVKDGTERTVEDLLKKLPGLDINENGKVTNNGNVVGQVLVEGNELFGRNHKMATQNITADMIEGIDLWQNYTTISGNQSSALNLKLKDEYKARITGNAEANYGNKGSYLGHANVFKFGKAGNLALISDANSIAKDPIGIMDFYEMNKQEEIDNTDGVTSVDTPSFLNNDGRIKSKDNLFGALQYSKSGKKLSVTAFSIFDTSQLEKFSTINRVAFPGQPANYNFFESKSEKNNGYFGTLQVKVKRIFTDNSFLYYSFGYNPSEDHFNQDIDRNTFIKNSFFDIGNSVKSSNFGNFLSWNKNFGNSKMTFAFSQQQNNYQSNLDINSTENLFQNPFNSLGQILDSDSKKYALDFYLKNKFSFMTVNLRSGYSNKNENASMSEIFTDEAESRILKTNHFLNEIFAQKFVGAFDFSGTFSAHFLNFNQVEKTYFEKNFKIKFQPKANVKTVFALEYANKYKSPEFIQLLYNRNYNRNLSYIANSSLLPETLMSTNAFKLNFIRFNLNKGNHFLAMLVYEKANSNFSSDVSNYGQFSETLNVIGNLDDRWFLIVSDDRRIGGYFSLKSKFTGLYTRTNNFINHQHNQTDLKNFEIGQRLRTNFKESSVQFDVGYTFTKSFFEQSLFNTSSSQQNLKLSAGIRTNIQKEWIGSFLGEYLIQKTQQNTIKNFLLGGQISYRKENSLFEYNLTMNNVLNLNSFHYINSSVSLLGTDEASVTALHGYIMGGLKYYF